MFGIWALFAGLAGIKEGINSIKYNKKSYEDSLIEYYSGKNRSRVYETWSGRTYDMDTGKQVRIDNYDGETRFVKDWKTDKIIKDLYEMDKLAEFWHEYKYGSHKVILFADDKRIRTLWKTCRWTRYYREEGKQIMPFSYDEGTGLYTADKAVYAHVKTGRLCYKRGIKGSDYVNAMWGGIYGEIVDYKDRQDKCYYSLPHFYCDIWTNEIVDWDDEDWFYLVKMHYKSQEFRYKKGDQVIKWDYTALQRAVNAYNQICRPNTKDFVVLCFENFKNGIFNMEMK